MYNALQLCCQLL